MEIWGRDGVGGVGAMPVSGCCGCGDDDDDEEEEEEEEDADDDEPCPLGVWATVVGWET